MLESVHIQNYRLFKEFHIDNLARVNLIVGKNNVGKSSFLEAVHILISQKNPGSLLDLFEARGEIAWIEDNSIVSRYPSRLRGCDISHLFYGHDLSHERELTIESDELRSLSVKVRYIEDQRQPSFFDIDERESSAPAQLIWKYSEDSGREIKLPVVGGLIDVRRTRVPTKDKGNGFHSNYITSKGLDYEFLAKLWDQITLTPKEDDVIFMLKILDQNIERISFQSRQSPNSGILLKLKDQPRPVPLGSMGDGMHRILAVASALSSAESGYLLIDEIDTGLHYRTITDVWRLVMETAERLNIQVFATTHSWDCVRSFAEALNIENDKKIGALFRLQRRGENIEAARYEADRIAFAIEHDVEIR